MSIDATTGRCNLCGDKHTPLSQVMQVNIEMGNNCTLKWIALSLDRIASTLEARNL